MQGRPPIKDIFGFERDRRNVPPVTPGSDKPIMPLRTEMVMDGLSQLSVGLKRPKSSFPNQLEWGDTPGSLQVYISPEGSHRAIMRRLILDLEGNAAWVCKRVFPLFGKDQEYDEQSWIATLHDTLLEVDTSFEEMPARDWNGLDRLAMRVAQRVRRDSSSLFVGEMMRKLDEDNYLVYSYLTGDGVGAPNQRRVESFDINISYVRTAGLIRIFGYDVSSPMSQHTWQIQPARWDECFAPVQGKEIEDAIGKLVGSI